MEISPFFNFETGMSNIMLPFPFINAFLSTIMGKCNA